WRPHISTHASPQKSGSWRTCGTSSIRTVSSLVRGSELAARKLTAATAQATSARPMPGKTSERRRGCRRFLADTAGGARLGSQISGLAMRAGHVGDLDVDDRAALRAIEVDHGSRVIRALAPADQLAARPRRDELPELLRCRRRARDLDQERPLGD